VFYIDDNGIKEILRSHSIEDDSDFLGCETVLHCERLSTFQKCCLRLQGWAQ